MRSMKQVFIMKYKIIISLQKEFSDPTAEEKRYEAVVTGPGDGDWGYVCKISGLYRFSFGQDA